MNEFFRIARDFLWELLWTAILAWLVFAVVCSIIDTFIK